MRREKRRVVRFFEPKFCGFDTSFRSLPPHPTLSPTSRRSSRFAMDNLVRRRCGGEGAKNTIRVSWTPSALQKAIKHRCRCISPAFGTLSIDDVFGARGCASKSNSMLSTGCTHARNAQKNHEKEEGRSVQRFEEEEASHDGSSFGVRRTRRPRCRDRS